MNNQETNNVGFGLAQVLGILILLVMFIAVWGSQQVLFEKFEKTPLTVTETAIVYSTIMLHLIIFNSIKKQ